MIGEVIRLTLDPVGANEFLAAHGDALNVLRARYGVDITVWHADDNSGMIDISNPLAEAARTVFDLIVQMHAKKLTTKKPAPKKTVQRLTTKRGKK